jgi:hypothetical protein
MYNPYYADTTPNFVDPPLQGKEKRVARRAERAASKEAGTWNPWFKSEGFEMGADIGMAALSAAPQAVEYGMDVVDSINEYRDMKFNPADVTIDGVPSYQGVSRIGSQVRGIDVDDAGKGLIAKGAMTGASIGGSIGMAASPIGGLIGAGAGAIAGVVGGLFGRKKAKNEAEEAIERGQQQFMVSQNKYNEGVEGYFDDVDMQRASIQGERNRQSRQFGLNQFRDPFRSIV